MSYSSWDAVVCPEYPLLNPPHILRTPQLGELHQTKQIWPTIVQEEWIPHLSSICPIKQDTDLSRTQNQKFPGPALGSSELSQTLSPEQSSTAKANARCHRYNSPLSTSTGWKENRNWSECHQKGCPLISPPSLKQFATPPLAHTSRTD